jgi:hypothetical protein
MRGFVIRKAQMHALAEPREARLVDALTTHLDRFFPTECAALGPLGLCTHIQESLRHARAQGLRAEASLFKYLNLSMLHGPRLGARPGESWMADMLADPEVSDPDERLHRVYQRVMARLRTEEQNQRAREAFSHGR